MNKITGVIVLSLFFLCGKVVFGQTVQLSENPEEFAVNIQALMASSNKPEARKAGDDFLSMWQSGKLSQAQQKQLVLIGQKMQKRKIKAVPGFDYFASIFSNAVNKNLSGSEIDNLLSVTDKVLDKEVNNNALLKYLSNLKVFFDLNALHTSNYNSLFVSGGTFSFDYVEVVIPEANISLDDEPVASIEESPESSDNSNWFNDWDTPSDTGQSSSIEDAVAATVDIVLPEIQGPIIKFEKVNFTIKTNFDSTTLTGTTGSYLLLSELFVGEGGRFDWTIAGLDPSVVYAEFTKYSFRPSSPSIEAEKVNLHYPTMVDETVEGVFEYKSKKHKSADDAQYPRFKSYSNNIKVKNIGQNLQYTGGFAMAGNKIYSSSVNQGQATIKLNIEGVEKFRTTSSRFQLGDSIISASRASVTILNKGDTLHHPAIQFKYNKNSGDLRVRRDDGSYRNMPFHASAFEIDFIADIIVWNIKNDSMDISILGARNQIPAIFESRDYFNDREFDNLKGLYSFHPLQLAVNYSNLIKSKTFYSEDLAKKYKQNPKIVKSSLVELEQRGFLDMNFLSGEVTLKDKAFHYSDSRRNRKDFDNMLIPSIIASKPNATYNIAKERMTIRGVKEFYLSDSLNTYIRPTNAEIILLKNRDFQFSGTINSGNFEFHGSNFQFRYDSFVVSMQLIDSIKFVVETVDEKGNKVRKQLDNQLEFSSGTLYINEPDNKSSRKKFPQYPIFDATTGATVFFDGKEINKGSYDKSLSFDVPPFRIDSLSASDPAAISFEGTFKSDGMFPEFKEKLRVRDDGSLGFEHKLPPQGYPIYGGIYKGNPEIGEVLTMTQKGLRGSGTIEYLTSSFDSKEFIFYIDSVKTHGTLATVKAGNLNGASYPSIIVEDYKMKWLPNKDTLAFANNKNPIQLYDKTATLNGKVNLSTKGLFGNGTLVTRGSIADSKFFTFREKEYLGRKAQFKIQSNDPAKPAFTGNDVKLDFNLEENYAKISPEIEGTAALNFPFSQYKSSINEAIWKLDDKKILMSIPEGSDASNSYFYSTRKDQDSLAFNATSAEYDIAKLTLNIKGVPFIKVADAKIIPSEGEVFIKENANFQPLTKADILIDTLNEFHSLFDGNVNILSRTKFTGNATYRFVNTVKDTFAIKFDKFELEKVGERKNSNQMQTVSSGTVSEEDKFLIAPKIYFRGKATMYANRKPLELNGHVKLDLDKFPGYNRWITYKRTGDVDEIVIDFDNNTTDTGRKLTAGLHLSSDNSLYFTFADDKQKPVDHDIFLGNGLLTYNESTKQFRLIDSLKDKGQSFEGNSMVYDEENSLLKYEGKLNLVRDYKDFSVISAGNGIVKIDSGVYTLNTLLGLNYNIPSKANEQLIANLKEVVENAGVAPSTYDKTDLLYKIGAIAGNSVARMYDAKTTTENAPLSSVSSKFLRTLVFTDVNFRWSEPFKAFYSVGKLNLANVMNTDLNIRSNGFIEVRKTPNGGEVVSVFLEVTSQTFYFFRFENNKLWVFSSDEKFNAAVDSKSKGESVKPGQYSFVLSNMADMLTFIDRFRKNYFGIEEPYRFDGTKEEVIEETTPDTKVESDDGF